ncbi:molybdopterin-guanine dinucleotide biosynthesis protein B [Minwuia thermotolerans]|uniref:Molybdopterin-guanine dinucleotide biosynthesis protein B n=1 Tax=Minwuia thermotolerans TaxID=2056226 RepID=A0A2M9G725_9PROT|nr:molybdopterin-guanine dinucleotide biosynthesis protein B [Minwuia thermotolerans]PJK31514.1 molybdopterin-guanine dinucleotide biosynthesis protein B [Minwuia thermotolerans]
MKVLGLAGWSGSGKTTLMVALIPLLRRRGLTVSTIKHAHHRFDVDTPGKDSWRHRDAGASEVMVASSQRFALMHELRGASEPTLDELLARMAPVDLVLVEGFKREGHSKIEVHRAATGKPPLYPDDPAIVAIASDMPIEAGELPLLDLNDAEGIAEFAARFARRPGRAA